MTSMPTRANRTRASSSCSSDPAISTGCAASPSTVAAHDANCPDNAMLTEPGTCAAANSSPVRTSSTISPSSSMAFNPPGVMARSGGKSDNAASTRAIDLGIFEEVFRPRR